MQACSLVTDPLVCFPVRLTAEEMTDGPQCRPLCLLPSIMKRLIPAKSPSFLLFLPLPARGRRTLLIPASVLKADAMAGGDEAGDPCLIQHGKLITQE